MNVSPLIRTASYSLFFCSVTFASCSPGAETDRLPIQTEPSSGELDYRIAMAAERLLGSGVPAFTADFILADVQPSGAAPRRFSNYSGDLSGRYLSALAGLPSGLRGRMPHGLVDSILILQQPDGRFGRSDLQFEADLLGPDHMALLWGNGRLLVGLLDEYRVTGDRRVLNAASRLGGFLVSTIDAAARPEVAERLVTLGAAGYICFTQMNEGLVALAEHSDDLTFLHAAIRVSEMLPPRGIQHSHGYLTTLRGMLAVYERSGDIRWLQEVERRENDLVGSSDLLVYGGVAEFFGGYTPGKDVRDEGCSQADITSLQLSLWRNTGRAEYLDRAESALLNHLYFNQFDTGDFGHHVLSPGLNSGFQPGRDAHRAWWCCTMHGLDGLQDARRHVVTTATDTIRLNLYVEGHYPVEGAVFSIEREIDARGMAFRVSLTGSAGERRLAVRVPSWAGEATVQRDGEPAKATVSGSYLVVDSPLTNGESARVTLTPRLRAVLLDGRQVEAEGLPSSVTRAHLFWGPYMLGIDAELNPYFFGEPSDGNVLLIPASGLSISELVPGGTADPSSYLAARYEHDSFPGIHDVILRPLSEQTFAKDRNVRVLFNVRGSGRPPVHSRGG